MPIPELSIGHHTSGKLYLYRSSMHIILRLAIGHECNAMSLSFIFTFFTASEMFENVINTLFFDNMVKLNTHLFKK